MQLLKSQITSTKSQINSKSEISMTKQNIAHNEAWWQIKASLGHWSLEFGYCLLFDAWDFLHPWV